MNEARPNSGIGVMADSSLKLTQRLLTKHRFRIAGTPECRLAAREIANIFRRSCDNVFEETFSLHPKALWLVGKALSIIYLAAALLGILGAYYLLISSFLCLLGVFYGIMQYVFYSKLFDPLFPSSEGQNAVGSLEPTDAVRQQVLVVGHHDSPFIFSFLSGLQRIAYFRFLLGIIAYLFLSAWSTTGAIGVLAGSTHVRLQGASFWIVVIGALFALPLFFMMSSKASPGAGDNLNSISMAAIIARHFQSERQENRALKHTRLIVLSTDGEEIGQRGAMEYVQQHKNELLSLPTFVLNIDSVYYLKDLTVLTRDRNFTRKLSDAMATDLQKISHDLGIKIKRKSLPFGGGGTDASPFAAIGVESVSIIGMPTGLMSNEHIYHTEHDTVENIEPAAVAAAIDIAISYIKHGDAVLEG